MRVGPVWSVAANEEALGLVGAFAICIKSVKRIGQQVMIVVNGLPFSEGNDAAGGVVESRLG